MRKKRKLLPIIGAVCAIIIIVAGVLGYLILKKPTQYEREAFINASIYTAESDLAWADTMVIDKDEIIFVGSYNEAEKYIDQHTKVHDVEGKLILPGFVDSHNHIGLISGQLGLEKSLLIDSSWDKERILKELERFIKKNKKVETIVGFGFDSNVFGEEGPTAAALDKLEMDRPVFILDDGGHSAWVNSKAMEIGNINKDTPDAVPGVHYFQRDKAGNPTGWLKESQSFVPLAKKLDIIDTDTAVKGAELLFPIVSQFGITTIYDAGMMGFEEELLAAYQKMEKKKQLPFRVVGSYMIQSPKVIPTAIESLTQLNKTYQSDLMKVDTMKIHYDGTLEAGTAAMFENYGANHDKNGDVLFDSEQLNKLVYDISKAGFNSHIHAIGDKAIDHAIAAYENLKQTGEDHDTRKTIAHVQFFRENTVDRLAALEDVVIQTTPGWFGASDYTLEAVGKELYERQGFFNSLDKKGVKLSFGSDFPVGLFSGLNPFYNMAVGHTRQNPDDPTGKTLPPAEEALSMETLVKGYTINGAYQLGIENEVGSLKAGKKADFVIVDNNIFESSAEEIADTKIVTTYMNGDITFEKGIKSWLIERFIMNR